ncbi:MAG: T9SS type A sorting domain-containing protein [Ketobacter sp.]|nr:T9SS type A sorting domain-containing protein [Ketobacter sp.]
MKDLSRYVGKILDVIPCILAFIMLCGSLLNTFCSIESHGQSLSIEDDSVEVGKTINVPVFLDVENQAPTAYQFYLLFDSLGLRYDGLSVAGTTSERMLLNTNMMENGFLKIAAAGVDPITTGNLLNLQFTGLQERTDSLRIEGAKIDELALEQWSNAKLRVLEMFLPIDLVEFRVFKADETTVIVRWVTASENNVDQFYVDRYRLGGDEGSWIEIGSHPSKNPMYGAGYSYLDNNVAPGVYEYRMRAVDFDGSFLITPPRPPVSIGNGTNTEFWPNPVASSIWYSVEPSTSFETQVEVFDMTGRRVAQDAIPMNYSVPRSLDLSDCASGVYVIRITRAFRTESKLISKL